ncbi:Uncharacterized protein RNJ44_00431 [Nakaseomyces bracarensis]|uniref:Uncharacterized protein n=1 Tax=Nakaseomyces bracarensis TaxID=273131 RepID=A0ABR4NSR9_9SACH
MNIWVAASDGRGDLVEKFLSEGFSANSKDPNGYTPVHAAAAYGHLDLLRMLCKDREGDINVRDSDGDTPLHHCEDAAVAKVIIEELGGDHTLVNDEGKTALQVFEEDGEFPELIQYMREKSGLSTGDSLGIDQEQLAQFKDSIRYTLEQDPGEITDPESLARRKRLEEIIMGENPEQELEGYIREMVRTQLLQGDEEEPDSKRRR